MLLTQHRRAIGVYPSRREAGQALYQLVVSGFPLAKVFLVGKDSACDEQGDDNDVMNQLVDRAKAGAITGTTTGLVKGLVIGNVMGGTAGLALGLGILALPGVGQVALASAIGFTLLSGGVGTAAGGLIGALLGLGLTEQQAKAYSELVSCGNYLVIMNGTDDEIHRAESILKAQKFHKKRHLGS